MCQIIRSWPPQPLSSSSEREKRRKSIQKTIESVVSLPERLNTEASVEIVFNATKIVAIANSATLPIYKFVLTVAATQVAQALSTRESAERWLEFHDGGLTMIEDELVKIVSILWNSNSLSLTEQQDILCVRTLCASLASILLKASCAWQSKSDLERWCKKLTGVTPVGGLFTILRTSLLECAQKQRYVKRGILDSKSDQEETFRLNNELRMEIFSLFSSTCHFSHVAALPLDTGVVQEIVGFAQSCIVEPHYKTRDFLLARHCIIILCELTTFYTTNATNSDAVLRPLNQASFVVITAVRDFVKRRLVELGNNALLFRQPQTKEELKELWMCGLEKRTFAVWDITTLEALIKLCLAALRLETDLHGASASHLLIIVVENFGTQTNGFQLAVLNALMDEAQVAHSGVDEPLVLPRHIARWLTETKSNSNVLLFIDLFFGVAQVGKETLSKCDSQGDVRLISCCVEFAALMLQTFLACERKRNAASASELDLSPLYDHFSGVIMCDEFRSLQESFRECGLPNESGLRLRISSQLLQVHALFVLCFLWSSFRTMERRDDEKSLAFRGLSEAISEFGELKAVVSRNVSQVANIAQQFEASQNVIKQQAALTATCIWRETSRWESAPSGLLLRVNEFLEIL